MHYESANEMVLTHARGQNFYVNVHGHYIIKNHKGEYLQVISPGIVSDGSDADVRWTDRRALASQWHRGMPDRVIIMEVTRDGIIQVASGWCVGLIAAEKIMEKHGGHLAYVHRRHHAIAA